MISKIATVAVYDDAATCRTQGVHFTQKLNEMQWGTFATFADQDGNEFLLKG